MKRRNFLASIAGLFAAPIIAKEADPVHEIGIDPASANGEHHAVMICDARNKTARIITVKSRQVGYSAKQAEVMRELEKIAGEGQYRWMSENLKKALS